MAVANYHEDYAAKAQQRALMEAAPCPLCQMKVTPENWQHHFAFHHPGVHMPPFPVKDTLKLIDLETGEITTPALTDAEREDLARCEVIIERGIKVFQEVGDALLHVRDNTLYRETHHTFEQYCRERWDLKRQRAYELMEAAKVVENLSEISDKLPVRESHAAPLASLDPDEQRLVWDVVQQTAPAGKVTAAHVKSVVNVLKEVSKTDAIDNGTGEQIKVADVFKAAVIEETYERMKRQEQHIADALEKKQDNVLPFPSSERLAPLMSSDSPEWYTPTDILKRVQTVMGAIDLDPCSNSQTAPNVPAAQHYTAADDGLTKDWNGRVYMNPPYGREIVEWVEKVVNEFKAGRITQALVLVPSRTDTEWFRMLRDYPRCFINGRLKFSESENAAPFPNMVVSLGCDRRQFIEVFGEIGDVYERVTA